MDELLSGFRPNVPVGIIQSDYAGLNESDAMLVILATTDTATDLPAHSLSRTIGEAIRYSAERRMVKHGHAVGHGS